VPNFHARPPTYRPPPKVLKRQSHKYFPLLIVLVVLLVLVLEPLFPGTNSPQASAKFADTEEQPALRQLVRTMESSRNFSRKTSEIMGLLKTRVIPAAAVLMVLSAAPQSHGDDAYLHRIGPAPLRFSLAAATFSFHLPAILLPPTAPTNSTELAAGTNSVSTNSASIPFATVPLPPNFVPPPAVADPTNHSVQTASASDLLVVSPQMLTEYFQPGSEGTNSAASDTLPAPGFTPPLIHPSSQATYRNP